MVDILWKQLIFPISSMGEILRNETEQDLGLDQVFFFCRLGASSQLLPSLALSQIRAHAIYTQQLDSLTDWLRAAAVSARELSGFWLQLCRYESFKYRNFCYMPIMLDIMFLFLNVKIIQKC